MKRNKIKLGPDQRLVKMLLYFFHNFTPQRILSLNLSYEPSSFHLIYNN